jgi:hypothetical protein
LKPSSNLDEVIMNNDGNMIAGLVKISVQHELAQELEFKDQYDLVPSKLGQRKRSITCFIMSKHGALGSCPTLSLTYLLYDEC